MKRYHIAGLTVDMETAGRTERQAQAYLADTEGLPDITIRCNVAKVFEVFPQLDNEDDALYVGTGMVFSRKLLAFSGLFLHASAVVLDGKAYLFSANSGTGKSTHTEKWCRLFGAYYLNDDKPVLRLVDGKWMAYGTPWSGKHDLSSPVGVPLGGIAFLKRGPENAIRSMTVGQSLPLFMAQSLRSLNQEDMDRQLALLDLLMKEVPIWELFCRNEDAAAILSRDVMTRKESV